MSDATTYLVLKATRFGYGTRDPSTGLRGVESVKVVRSRTSRPRDLGIDEVAVRITVRVPNTVFDPIVPDAVAIVPREFVQCDPVEVRAVPVEDDS